MAKTVKAQVSATTSAVEDRLLSIKSLADLYDSVHKFEKQANNEKAFLKKFGSRKQWLGQFKPQPYDKRA